RAEISPTYARAVAQRNAALRRVRAGEAGLDSVEPWTAQVAAFGSDLDAARAELTSLLAPGVTRIAASLGLGDAVAAYEGPGLTVEELDERLPRDLERAVTGAGPHLRDASITAGGPGARRVRAPGERRGSEF